jgi:adenylate cyclase
MGVEIERKFLVVDDAWRGSIESRRDYKQGYLAIDEGTTVRVRTDGGRAWLTIKGRGQGITRPEFEYKIPVAEAAKLLALCQGRLVEKARHLVPDGDLVWEIDEFSGSNAGLIVAEIELPNEAVSFPHPSWLGQEVTADPRYLNANLAVHPFGHWPR